jgi:tetratricopeptide (TPR) repeat protein
MSCLQDRLGSMKALSDVFVDANATVVENAVNAASGLPTLEGCADVKLLRAVIAPPDGAILRARVASLRADLARVRALHQAGQCHAATTTRRALIADADALGYAPLQAESLTVTLRQSGDCMNHIEAIRDAKRAVMVALGAHHGEVAAEAAILVALFEADRTADFSHARDWIDLATAIMQGMASEHPVLETWRLQALAVVYEKEHDLARALDSARGALSLVEKTQGREHVDYAIALMTVATILVDTVQLDDALTYYQTAAERAKALVGPDSTVLAMIEANRAETLNKLHRYDEARTAALVALRIWHRAGATGLYEGFALTNLGEALLGAGRPDEAAAEFEKALVLLNHDSTAVPEATRFGLARALWQSHGSQHRALTLARGARAGYQRFGDQARIAEVDAWLVAHKQRAD